MKPYARDNSKPKGTAAQIASETVAISERNLFNKDVGEGIIANIEKVNNGSFRWDRGGCLSSGRIVFGESAERPVIQV